MSLLSPKQIHFQKIVEKAFDSSDIKEVLNNTGLSLTETLSTLSEIMRGASENGVRLQAAKLSAQIHGLLKNENAVVAPTFNIIIKDHPDTINPIFIPREISNGNG